MNHFKNVATFVFVTLIAIFVIGCTTANHGLAPAAVQEQSDTFKFKTYVGGFSGGETADRAARVDIDAYQKSNGFKSYTILDKRYNFIPSYFEYTVHFSRD